MPAPGRIVRALFAALVSVALAFTGLQLVAESAEASISTKIAAFPYAQDWSTPPDHEANDNWSGVSGVEGLPRTGHHHRADGADPQTLLGESPVASNTASSANQTNRGDHHRGRVAEFESHVQSIGSREAHQRTRRRRVPSRPDG